MSTSSRAAPHEVFELFAQRLDSLKAVADPLLQPLNVIYTVIE
jgi:hypothetical protein